MKVLKIGGMVVGIIVLVIAILGFAVFGGLQAASAGPSLGSGIDRVQAGYSTAYVLDAGNGEFVLIDAGADVGAKRRDNRLSHCSRGTNLRG